MAIETRKPLPGLVHHSDRGIQYASAEYVAILKQHAMARSMGGHRTGSSSGFSRGGSDIDDRKCQGKRNAGSCKNHSDEVSRRQTHDEQWHTLTRFWKERNRLEGIGVCSRFAASFPVSSREKELSSHPAIVEPPP